MPPASLICFTAAAPLVALRPASTTVAPAAAIPSAMPSPMPPLPPVTIATRPDRSNKLMASPDAVMTMAGTCRPIDGQPRASRPPLLLVAMNFDDALKHHLPRVWFRFKFLKYKYFRRGEPELWLIRHLVEPGTTALDVGASIGIYAAEMARYAAKVIAFEANPEVAAFTARVAPRNVEVDQRGALVARRAAPP